MSDQQEAVTIEVVRGTPTAEELAAVVAVLSDEYATEVANLESEEDPAASVWMRSRRPIRKPLNRQLGWGGFRG